MTRARLLFFPVMTAALVTALAVIACLDLTPIHVPSKDSGLLADASCTRCLADDCTPVLDGCRADPRCAPVLVCLEALSCFDEPVLDQKINCGLPCLEDAGITTTTDPVVDRLQALIQCGQSSCPIDCNVGDGGLSLDAL